MSLEHEIKQTKPFRSEIQKLVINLQVTTSALNSAINRALKVHGISHPQFNVLRILKGRHPHSYCNQEIAERMIDKSSNCTRIVDKLCDKQLISRKINKADKRGVDIAITKKGLQLLEKIDTQSPPLFKKMMVFDAEKAFKMNNWLNELRDLLKESELQQIK